ncbi:hypothetical protein D3C86_1820640 [compost metagenome]
MMSMRPSTPQCSAEPRPFFPTKPTAWLSSTMTMAPYVSARSHTPPRLAMMPSIENTPSVAISLKRLPSAFFSSSSSAAMSLLA